MRRALLGRCWATGLSRTTAFADLSLSLSLGKCSDSLARLTSWALDGDDLKTFIETIANAKSLTEQKRYYASSYGIENYVDIVNGKTDTIKKAENYDRYNVDTIIEWWRKLATKRFNKIKEEGRLRNDLEIWTKDSQIDIIR